MVLSIPGWISTNTYDSEVQSAPVRELDDVDREILRLLLADGRRSYADIADHVDRSPPAVSDRIDRLTELGVIRSFTVDLDRSQLLTGIEVLVELSVAPGEVGTVRDEIRDLPGVEHVFETAGGRLVTTMTVPDGDVASYLAGSIDLASVRELDVNLLADATWDPTLGDVALGLTCAECDNTVTSEGVTATVGGDRYEFCCPSCRERFVDRYERLEADA